MITKYFNNIEQKILLFKNIIINHSFSIKYYNDKMGFISGKIIFVDESILKFTEVKDIDFCKKDKYSYQYMNENNELIFRYDNSKHYKELIAYFNCDFCINFNLKKNVRRTFNYCSKKHSHTSDVRRTSNICNNNNLIVYEVFC